MTILIITLYVVEKISGQFNKAEAGIISRPAKYIVKFFNKDQVSDLGYSNNIFDDLEPRKLQREYTATNDMRMSAVNKIARMNLSEQ